MPVVDISIVTYAPDLAALDELVGSLREQMQGVEAQLLIQDNSLDLETTAQIERHLAAEESFVKIDVQRSGSNLGFGRGHNANAARGRAAFFFVLNQDCVLEPNVLAPLLAEAGNDDVRVAAWELRQLPYEHPKAYDPATLDTSWVSGAATLFRRSAFDAVGGFEPRIFMYGEDVDLSWRLRASGFRLRYLPHPALDGQRSRGIDRVDEPRFGEKARCACELLREIPAYPADERL